METEKAHYSFKQRQRQRDSTRMSTMNAETTISHVISEQPPLYELAMDGDYDRVKSILLSLRARLEDDDEVESNDEETKDALRNSIREYVNQSDDDFGRTALFYACNQNSIAMTLLLLSSPFRADPNSLDLDGYPPLFVPCERGYLCIVQLLLRFGADVNQQVLLEYEDEDDEEDEDDNNNNNKNINDNTTDNYYETPAVHTPLLAAVFQQQVEIVELLLSEGANPNVITDTLEWGKKTTLEIATEVVPNRTISQLLVRHGAQLHQVTGCTTTNTPSNKRALPAWMTQFNTTS